MYAVVQRWHKASKSLRVTMRLGGMMRLHLSVLGSIIFLFYTAVCIAALARPSSLTVSALHTVRMCLLFASVLGIVLGRAEQRATWTGVAVIGWFFFGLTNFGWLGHAPLLSNYDLLQRLVYHGVLSEEFSLFYQSWFSVENLILAGVGGLVGYLVCLASNLVIHRVRPCAAERRGLPDDSAFGRERERWPHFSVMGSLLFCFYATICIAALASPSPLTSGVLYAVQMCFLFAAIVGSISQRTKPRAFWLGFALFGWGFFGLPYLPWRGSPPLLVGSYFMSPAGRPGLSPQDLSFFFQSCDSVENVVLASVGGLVGYLFGLRRDKPRTGTINAFTSSEQRNR
jgi:hypothetical protein